MHNSIFFEPHLEGFHHLCSTSSFSSAAKDTYISLVEAIYSSPACDSSERGEYQPLPQVKTSVNKRGHRVEWYMTAVCQSQEWIDTGWKISSTIFLHVFQ